MCDTAGLHAADINSDNMTRIGDDNETKTEFGGGGCNTQGKKE